jgi:hypothetical protein
MYKLVYNPLGPVNVAMNLETNTSFPFAPDNTDYANFKKQILADEAQLQDADGNTMTPEQAKTYVATLP